MDRIDRIICFLIYDSNFIFNFLIKKALILFILSILFEFPCDKLFV
jgi:hypothetical protein